VHIKAGAAAKAPLAPQLQAVTESELTLRLFASEEDGGSVIDMHKIFRDTGNSLSGAVDYSEELIGYDGSASTYEVADLTLGVVYRFVYVAHNEFGDSQFSMPLIAGLGAPPIVSNPP
jgi:hypothetical protein